MIVKAAREVLLDGCVQKHLLLNCGRSQEDQCCWNPKPVFRAERFLAQEIKNLKPPTEHRTTKLLPLQEGSVCIPCLHER